jgi:hypothetical protein
MHTAAPLIPVMIWAKCTPCTLHTPSPKIKVLVLLSPRSCFPRYRILQVCGKMIINRVAHHWPLTIGRSAGSTSPEGHVFCLIKKPKGQVGCVSRGGYSLKTVLSDWDPQLYTDVQECFLHSDILPRTNRKLTGIYTDADSTLYRRTLACQGCDHFASTPTYHHQNSNGGRHRSQGLSRIILMNTVGSRYVPYISKIREGLALSGHNSDLFRKCSVV